MKKELKVKEGKPKITKSYYINCPTCNQEISGRTQKQVISYLRTHFKLKHPEQSWEKEVVF